MFYVLQASTAIILFMAANTSYAGLPMLLSLLGKDGYAPRQFNARGGRLGFSNGIIALALAACILVILFGGHTHSSVPLYATGVFLSFTLSQSGMFLHWLRSDDKGKRHKAIINGSGAVITAVTTFIIMYSKFIAGAWIAIGLIILLVVAMKITKNHYDDVSRQLRLEPDEVQHETEIIEVKKHVIVLIGALTKPSLKAINYARRLANDRNIVAFTVSIDQERSNALREKWKQCGMRVPLVIKYSPFREIVSPLMKYIESEEHDSRPGDMITVVMPQFVVSKAWQNIYHNQMGFIIRQKLLRDRHIAVVTVPYILDKEPKNGRHAPPT
jgi:hypothetical protein